MQAVDGLSRWDDEDVLRDYCESVGLVGKHRDLVVFLFKSKEDDRKDWLNSHRVMLRHVRTAQNKNIIDRLNGGNVYDG